MASYNPPTEYNPIFNTSDFITETTGLTQGQTDLLYLSKVNSGTSTAPITNFNGAVNVSGDITGSTLIQSNTTSISTNRIFDNLFSGSTLTMGSLTSSNTINGNTNFGSIVSIKNKLKLSQMTNIDINSSAFVELDFPLSEVNTIRAAGLTAATIQLPAVTLNEAGLMFSFFKFQTNLAITFTSSSGIFTLNNLGSGPTTNTSLLSVDKQMTTLMCGFYGNVRYWIEVSNYSTFDRDYNNTIYPRLSQSNTFTQTNTFSNISVKGELRCYDTATPFTSYSKISTSGLITTYEAPNGISTSHMFKTYNSSGLLTGSQFEVTATANISRQIHTFTNRINWSVASYSFGSFTNGNLGYYLKETGGSQPLTNNVSTTILTTSSIPIGVWRIDFSVQLNAIATGSHTITQSQSYLSTISNAAIATAIPFTGSTLRSHTSETYAQNDIQIITSNITYQQSSAGVLYLNVLRTFTTGTFTAIGEVSITRIA